MRLVSVVGLCAALGCGSSSSGGGTPVVDAAAGGADAVGPAKDAAMAMKDPNAVIGSFAISLVPELKTDTDTTPAHTALLGRVSDGPSVPRLLWMTIDSGDGCQLQKPSVPFCDPGCGTATCVGMNKCQADPTPQNVGPVQVSGLGAMSFTSQPIANTYQLPGDLQLPYPPATEGADVSVAVSGGPYGAFTLKTKAVAALSWTNDLVLDRDKPAMLTWTPPTMTALARMQIKVDISHHGGATGQILCDVADSGSFTIPAKLITGLINLGVHGFPNITLNRLASSKVAVSAGQVEIDYQSEVTREVKVAGYDSCNEKIPCPAGKTCMLSAEVCVP